jgi:hypothetical protein
LVSLKREEAHGWSFKAEAALAIFGIERSDALYPFAQ